MPAEGAAPQGLRGWGVRLMGSRGRVPLVGCGAKPQGFYHAMAWFGEANKVSQSPHQMEFGIVGYTKSLDSLSRYVMMVSKVVLLRKTIVREKHEQIRNHSHAEISNF